MIRRKFKTTQIRFFDTTTNETLSKGVQEITLVGKHNEKSVKEELAALNVNFILKDFILKEVEREIEELTFFYNSQEVKTVSEDQEVSETTK